MRRRGENIIQVNLVTCYFMLQHMLQLQYCRERRALCPCPESCQHAGTFASLAPAMRGGACIVVVVVVRASGAALISSACRVCLIVLTQ